MNILEVAEGEQKQGKDEAISYQITTTNWASSPTSVSAKAFLGTSNESEVTNTVFPTNSPSVSGDVITLSLLKNLLGRSAYRIDVQFDSGSNTYECFFIVRTI